MDWDEFVRQIDEEIGQMMAGWQRGPLAAQPRTDQPPWWGTGYGGIPRELQWYARQEEPTRYLPEAAKVRWRAAMKPFAPVPRGAEVPRLEPQIFPLGTQLPPPPRGEEWLMRQKMGMPARAPSATQRWGPYAWPTQTLEAIWPRLPTGEFMLGVEPSRVMKRAQLAVQEALIPAGRPLVQAPVSMMGYPQEVGARYQVGVMFGGALPEGMGLYRPGFERFPASELFSMKTMGIKAYMAPGEVPPGMEMLLPTPKDPISFARGVLSALSPAQLRAMGLPLREGRLEWTAETHQQIMSAAWGLIERNIQRIPITQTVHPSLLGAYGVEPTAPLGRVQVTQQIPTYVGPMMLQPRAEYMGRRPRINPEELAQLLRTTPEFGERLWRESYGWRGIYREPIQAMLGTLRGVPFEQLGREWQQVGAYARELQPEGRIGLSTLVTAAARYIRTPIETMLGGQRVTFPSPQAMLGLRAERELIPLEEEQARRSQARIFSLYGRWMRGMLGMGGQFAPQIAEHAGMGLVTEMGRFAASGRVQRLAWSAAPRRAIEGPPVASAALAPEEMVLGRGAMRRMFGVETPEQMAALEQALRGQPAVARGWRRPISDVEAQMGMRFRVLSEEMARERGVQLGPLGEQFAVSPFAMFIGIGDFDADRMIAVLESEARWTPTARHIGGRYAGRVQPGFWTLRGGEGLLQEQGPLQQRFFEMMQVHAPERVRGLTPGQLFQRFTTEWSEAYGWAQKMGPQTPEDIRQWFFQEYRAAPGTILESARQAMVSGQMMGMTYQAFGRAMAPFMGGREQAQRAIATGAYQPALDIGVLSPQLRGVLEAWSALGARTGTMARRLTRRPGEELQFEEMGRGPVQIGRLAQMIAQVPEWPAYARAAALAPTMEMAPQMERLIRRERWPEVAGMVTEESPMIAMIRQASMARGLGQQGWRETERGRAFWRMTAEEQRMGRLGEATRRMLRLVGRRGIPIGELRETLQQQLAATPGLSRLFGMGMREWGLQGVPTSMQPMAATLREIAGELGPAPAGPEVVTRAAQMIPGGAIPIGALQPTMEWPAAPAGFEERIAAEQARLGGLGVGAYWEEIRQRTTAAPPGGAPPTAGGVAGGGRIPPFRGAQAGFPEGWEWLGGFGEMLGGMAQRGGFLSFSPYGEGGQRIFGMIGQRPNVQAVQDAARNLTRWSDELTRVLSGTREMTPELRRATRLLGQWSQTIQRADRWMQEELGAQRQVPAGIAQAVGMAGPAAQRWGWMAPYAEQLQAQGVMQAAVAGGGGPPGPLGRAGGVLQRVARYLTSGWGLIYLARMQRMFMQPVQQWMGAYTQEQLAMQQAMAAMGQPMPLAGVPAQAIEAQVRAQQVQTILGRRAWEIYGPLVGAAAQPRIAEQIATGAAIGLPTIGVGMGFGALAAAAGAPFLPAAGIAAGVTALGISGLAAYGQVRRQGLPEAVGQALAGVWQQPLAAPLRGLLGPEVGQVGAGVDLLRQVFGAVGFRPGEEFLQRMQRAFRAPQEIIGPPEPPTTPEEQMELFARRIRMMQIPGYTPQMRAQLVARLGAAGVGIGQVPFIQWAGQQAQYGIDIPALMQQALATFGAVPGMGAGQLMPWLQQMQVPQLQALPFQLQQAGPLLGQMRRLYEVPLGVQQQFVGMPAARQARFGQVLQGAPLALQWFFTQQARQIRYQGWQRAYAAMPRIPEIVGAAIPEYGAMQQQIAEAYGAPAGAWEQMAQFISPLRYQRDIWALQDRQRAAARGYRQWQFGFQRMQIGARREYLGGVWGIQDQLRQLGYEQAMAGFGYQEAMAGLGYRRAMAGFQYQEQMSGLAYQQFLENWQLSMRQMRLQVPYQRRRMADVWGMQLRRREWVREDWETGETMQRLQWGWRMEDLRRGLRYARGPERAQLQRQIRREQVLENERRRRFEEQKKRQQEVWSYEDRRHAEDVKYYERTTSLQRERLQLSREHYEERKKLSDEYLEKQKAFYIEGFNLQAEYRAKQKEAYEERYDLETELEDLQRSWQETQLEWQETQLEKQEEYQRIQDEITDEMTEIQREYEEFLLQWRETFFLDPESVANLTLTFLDDWSQGVDDVAKKTFDFLNEWASWYEGRTPPPTEPVGDEDDEPTGQMGGIVMRPTRVLVGEAGPEAIIPLERSLTLPGLNDTNKLLSQVLAALLQLQNTFREVKVIADGREIALIVQPHLERGMWGQTYTQ